MVFAGIVAGGSGTRMKNADKPKQFLELGKIPIIIRTVQAFLECDKIDKIYIGIKSDWHDYTVTLLNIYRIDSKKVKVIDGGKSRNETVMNIVDSITKEYGCKNGDIILTHDAVRPFVSRKIIEDNIESALKYKACGTYIPAVDTIIKSENGRTADETLKRSELYQAQTPQSFDIGALCGCRNELTSEELNALTDTCGIFTACGIEIQIVQGEPKNFKITTDYDLKIAELLVKAK